MNICNRQMPRSRLAPHGYTDYQHKAARLPVKWASSLYNHDQRAIQRWRWMAEWLSDGVEGNECFWLLAYWFAFREETHCQRTGVSTFYIEGEGNDSLLSREVLFSLQPRQEATTVICFVHTPDSVLQKIT